VNELDGPMMHQLKNSDYYFIFGLDILEGVEEKDTVAFIEELILKQVI
jgi:hypothetical protein